MAILTWLTLWLAALVVSVILGPVVRVAYSLQCAHGVQSLCFVRLIVARSAPWHHQVLSQLFTWLLHRFMPRSVRQRTSQSRQAQGVVVHSSA